MDKRTKTRLSSFMTKILRHSPGKFGVTVDEKGFTVINQLIDAIKKDKRWNEVTKETIEDIVQTSEKQRFEIKEDKIRARYGHSFPVLQEKTEQKLPDFLYHGTARDKLIPILENKEGIKPMTRQYVHLSETKHFATLAAKRRNSPYLLKVDTHKALLNGTVFHFAGNEVWLSTEIDLSAIVETEKINLT